MVTLFKYGERISSNKNNLFVYTDLGDITILHENESVCNDIFYMIYNFLDDEIEKCILNYNFFILGSDLESKITPTEARIKTQIFNKIHYRNLKKITG